MKEVKEIIRNFLIAGGYDGLCSGNCHCSVEELIPCKVDFSCCRPTHFLKSDTEDFEENTNK